MGRHKDPEHHSPEILEDGRWVNVRGVQRWVPDPVALVVAPEPPEVPDECRDCERPFTSGRPHAGRGLCKSCYRRHANAGTIAHFSCIRRSAA